MLEITAAVENWTGTNDKFFLTRKGNSTDLQFEYKGWKKTNHYFQVSSYCWATYLRLLKKVIEEEVIFSYDERGNL